MLPVIVLVKGTDLLVRGAFVFTAIFFIVSANPLFLPFREHGVLGLVILMNVKEQHTRQVALEYAPGD